MLEFVETVINYIKDNSIADEAGLFSSTDINFNELNLDHVKVKAVLNLYFDKSDDMECPGSPLSDQSIKAGAMVLENVTETKQFKWS
jgi:hypothetical protein